ncbi:2'-5' RNA ligase family protein [Candidatus Daviesbacteria bacterium]|nr:2'-5' RNA ligase family protein [Candidatus Daviesbacteria bacterium]
MISKGHTLWLMPSGQTYERFADLIKKPAMEYNAPVFQPHITLLGEFMQLQDECIQKTKKLVTGQKPFVVNLQEIGFQDYFFRTLFVYAHKTSPLQNLHNKAKEIFQMQDIPSYMPHLSLLYGNFPQDVKNKIIQKIGKNQSAQLEINSVYLVKGGEIKDWQIISGFPLA